MAEPFFPLPAGRDLFATACPAERRLFGGCKWLSSVPRVMAEPFFPLPAGRDLFATACPADCLAERRLFGGCKWLSSVPRVVPRELLARSRLAGRYPRFEEISCAALHTSAEKKGRRFLVARDKTRGADRTDDHASGVENRRPDTSAADHRLFVVERKALFTYVDKVLWQTSNARNRLRSVGDEFRGRQDLFLTLPILQVGQDGFPQGRAMNRVPCPNRENEPEGVLALEHVQIKNLEAIQQCQIYCFVRRCTKFLESGRQILQSVV